LKVVKLEMKEAIERVTKLGLEVSYGDDVLNFLADRGFDPEMGARPLYRAIQSNVEDLVANELTFKKISAGDKIVLFVKNGEISLEIDNSEETNKIAL
jgi:ATP-dependent Clp protease ATP-binding subunit ClpA